MTLTGLAGWVAPAATMIAAMMTAANLGARFTGWGFVVFTIGSIAWSVVAISSGQQNLLWTNGFLTLVNLVGIWRWLGRQARYEDGGRQAAARSGASHVPSLFPVGAMAGGRVAGRNGETLGHVVDAMVRCADLGIAYVVISDDGVGGLGERLFAFDPAELRLSEDGFSCDLSSEELTARTPIEADRWPVSITKAGGQA